MAAFFTGITNYFSDIDKAKRYDRRADPDHRWQKEDQDETEETSFRRDVIDEANEFGVRVYNQDGDPWETGSLRIITQLGTQLAGSLISPVAAPLLSSIAGIGFDRSKQGALQGRLEAIEEIEANEAIHGDPTSAHALKLEKEILESNKKYTQRSTILKVSAFAIGAVALFGCGAYLYWKDPSNSPLDLLESETMGKVARGITYGSYLLQFIHYAWDGGRIQQRNKAKAERLMIETHKV